MDDLAALNAMDAGGLRRLLSGPPEQIAPLLRLAARGGAVEAQLRLAQMLLDGHGVEADPARALRWFIRAAEAGSPMAMNMVGRCLEQGHGTRIDKARAAEWYRAAAGRGLDWGMYNLATLMALGDGVEQDREGALALFRQAAAGGHAKSMNMVGSFHEDGWVVPRDRKAAALHYARAAAGGDFRGQFNHARLLIEDGHVAAALPWLRRMRETATPRFLAQARAWLASRDDPRLVQQALDLTPENDYAIHSH